ncbi:MAG: tyrosine-protein phosphatase [Chloroflexota bacterium]|nr:tyrosine-protein phosphatase [Dehalococcoidia bacterium]MDW8252297.1 tyrosine-protein phosphatase [Chloroflexota bacterium]
MHSLALSRSLDLAGVRNLRDIGGYPTRDGRQTRWRTLYRADSPHRLTEAGRRSLVALGVRTLIDLRRPSEIALAPYAFDSDGLVRRAIPLLDDGPARSLRSLDEVYRTILVEGQARLATVLRTLIDSLPAVVHCTAGKDRTGIVIALVLSLAGVPDEIVAHDYALTRACQTDSYWDEARQRAAAAGIAWEDYQQLLICPPELMLATLRFLRHEFGGAERYARSAGLSGREIDRLRQAIVE